MILVFAEFFCFFFYLESSFPATSSSADQIPLSGSGHQQQAAPIKQTKKILPSASVDAPWHFSLSGFDSWLSASCLDFLLFFTRFHANPFLVFPSVVRTFVQRQQIHFFSLQWPLTSNQCYQRSGLCIADRVITTQQKPSLFGALISDYITYLNMSRYCLHVDVVGLVLHYPTIVWKHIHFTRLLTLPFIFSPLSKREQKREINQICKDRHSAENRWNPDFF